MLEKGFFVPCAVTVVSVMCVVTIVLSFSPTFHVDSLRLLLPFFFLSSFGGVCSPGPRRV